MLPAWLQEIPPTHDLVWGGGVVGCRGCGAIAITATYFRLLRVQCRRTLPEGSRFRIERFLLGGLPPISDAWPDEGRLADERAVIAQLAHDPEAAAWRLAFR